MSTPGKLTALQVSTLLRPIRRERVLTANGQSHVPAYDVAAHLTRIFGYGGWDKDILDLTLLREAETTMKNNKPGWVITYSCTLRLTIKDPDGNVVAHFEDGACGSSTQPQYGEAHDMAMKSAISYALKRCAAFGLGDGFGLSLYNKGATGALVGVTLVRPEEAEPETVPDLEGHIEVPQSLGNDETQESVEDAEDRAIQTAEHDGSWEDQVAELAASGQSPIDVAPGNPSDAGTYDATEDPFHLEDPDYDPALFEHPDPVPSGEYRQVPSITDDTQPVKPGQMRRFQSLRRTLAIPDPVWYEVLKKDFGVTSSKDLTAGQGNDLIARLEAKAAARQGVPA